MPMQSMIEKQSMNINEIPDVKELVRGYFCGKPVLNSSIVINKPFLTIIQKFMCMSSLNLRLWIKSCYRCFYKNMYQEFLLADCHLDD